MSLNRFESFLKKLSRILYSDEYTPIVIDYLIRHKMAEPVCMT